MGSRIAYYLFILPISYLPYPLLYLLSDVFFLILHDVARYRRNVVLPNIRNSFPDLDEKEHMIIMRNFYRHFCDLILESLKGFTISKNELRKRFKLRNPEILDEFYAKGKDLVFVGGHFNNWEILALGIDMEMKHRPIGIYKRLENRYFDKKMKESREKYGLIMVPTTDTKLTFDTDFGEPTAIIFGIDQNPSGAKRHYWLHFLNQDTAVSFGAEKYAREYDRPVVYCVIHKVKRGYYEGELRIITEHPVDMPHGAIMELSTQQLENDIKDKPEFWLWTHKRWKRKRPAGE